MPGFDLRPFLYPARFPWQFAKIDALAARLPNRAAAAAAVPPVPVSTGGGVDKDKVKLD